MEKTMEKKKKDQPELNLKEIRKKLEEKIENALPEKFRNRHEKKAEEEIASPVETLREIDALTAKRVIEAILFSASKSVSAKEFKKILRGYQANQITQLIKELQAEYENEGRSFRINEIAGGFELATESEYYKWIQKADVQKKSKMATNAALETLAIIAYKQPVTRSEVEDIRGVDVSGVLGNLLERDFIRIAGRKDVPGRPLLYETSTQFLEHFGLKSLEELPRINEIKEIVQASVERNKLMEQEKKQQEQEAKEEQRAKIEKEQQNFAKEQEEVREKYREIADNIDHVTVLRERQLQEIINPPEPEEPVEENSSEDAKETEPSEAEPPEAEEKDSQEEPDENIKNES